MKISISKLKHLYVLYGSFNILLILLIILSSVYFYKKQSFLFKIENSLGNELINLSNSRTSSLSFAYKQGIEDIINLKESENNIEMINQLVNSKLIIDKILMESVIDDIHFKESLQGLVSDYEILISQNELLINYLTQIGDNNHGSLLNFKNAAIDFQDKIKSFDSNGMINKDLSHTILLVSFLVRNRDDFILIEINRILGSMKNHFSVPDSSLNNYSLFRISDSFKNLENSYNSIAKLILEIGNSEQDGLMKLIVDRNLKASLRINDAIRIAQNEKKTIEFNAIIVLILLLLITIAFNFLSSIYFNRFTRNVTLSLTNVLSGLVIGEFIKIDKQKFPFELHELADGIEDFSKKFLNSERSLKQLSLGNQNIDANKENYLELSYHSIFELKQKMDTVNSQLLDEKKKQAEMQWIKLGIEKLTEVIRLEFHNPLLHSNKIIFALTEYLQIPMGAIYHIKEEDGIKFIEMMASFAYGKEKQNFKKITMGEGIIGSAASEKKILNLTNVPESYFSIISGYSETKPKNILVSPIKLNEEIYGVIELASLTRFKEEELRFVEEVCKTIAYSFAISKVYLDTLNKLELSNLEIAQIRSDNETISIELEALKIQMNDLWIKSLDNDYVVEKINDFAIVINLDIDGNIRDVNARFDQFFKSEKKKFKHSNYREFMQENNPELDFETLWRNLRYGIKQELNQKVNINNEELYLNQHFIPMKDQKGRVKEIKILIFNMTNTLQ